jgi:hypothetical protein
MLNYGGLQMGERDIDTNRIDEAVLALMFLTLHDVDRISGFARAWKSFDWGAMNRLYEKDLICDPVNKAAARQIGTFDGTGITSGP